MTKEYPIERREIIVSRLANGQAVIAEALADEFAVSPDAIRRDLRALAAEGRCRRVYGGALPLSPASTSMVVRAAEAHERKAALAAAAVRLIRPGEFLFLDNGSTNLALAALLPSCKLTVVTNSAAIAAALVDRLDLRLHLLGGAVDAAIGGCVDTDAVLALQRMNIDRSFLGTCAASAGEGISAFDAADAAFKRVALTCSRQVALMVLTEKLGTRAPHRIASLDSIDVLVVEHDATHHPEFRAISVLGIEVITAAQPG